MGEIDSINLRLDRLEIEVRDLGESDERLVEKVTELGIKVDAISGTIERWQENIDKFWRETHPQLLQELVATRERLDALNNRVGDIQSEITMHRKTEGMPRASSQPEEKGTLLHGTTRVDNRILIVGALAILLGGGSPVALRLVNALLGGPLPEPIVEVEPNDPVPDRTDE